MSRTRIMQSRESEMPRRLATESWAVACLLIGISFLLSGCNALSSSDDEINLELGTFKVQVEGYLNQSFEGKAVFETIYSPFQYFRLMLQHPDAKQVQHFVLFEQGAHGNGTEVKGTQPDTGTYALANFGKSSDQQDPSRYRGIYRNMEISETFESRGGSLAIIVSNDNVIKGSFEFPAYTVVDVGEGESEEVEVQVSGEFYAELGETAGDVM